MFRPRRILDAARARAHSALGWVSYRLGWLRTSRRHFERVLLLRGADFRAYVHLGRIAFDQGDYSGWRREFEHARRADPARFARLQHPLELFEPRLAGTRFDPHGHDHVEDDRVATDSRATWRSLHPFGPRPQDAGVGEGFGRGTDLPLAPGYDPMLPSQQLDDVDESDLLHDDLDGLSPAIEDLHASADPFAGDRQPPLPPRPQLPDASLTGDDFLSPAERRRFQLRRPIDRREIARCDLNELARRLSS